MSNVQILLYNAVISVSDKVNRDACVLYSIKGPQDLKF
jgi:hypothetical protein